MNHSVNSALLLFPEEAIGALLTLLLILGGCCLLIGARRTAAGLIMTALTFPFISAIAEAVFDGLFSALPTQLVQPLAWLLMGVFGLMVAGTAMNTIFGQRVWDTAKGQLLAYVIRSIFRNGFRWLLVMLVLLAGVGMFLP